jgi:hypothetical protein
MKLRLGWILLRNSFIEWLEDKAPRLGAALAYYTAFSLSPLLVIVIAIAASGKEAAEGQIIAQACGFAALRAPAHFTSRVMRPMDWTQLSETAVNKTPGTDERVPASHTAIPYSTVSNQSPGVVALSLSGAGPSFLPSSECTRNTGSSAQKQSSSPSRAISD